MCFSFALLEEKRASQLQYENEVGMKFLTKLIGHRTRKLIKEKRTDELKEIIAVPIDAAKEADRKEKENKANDQAQNVSASPSTCTTSFNSVATVVCNTLAIPNTFVGNTFDK